MALDFELKTTDGLARRGVVTTDHGAFDTPAFMTVGTMGAAKGLTAQHLKDHGAQILLMNAFHLAWRPGEDLVREMGGLHRFTGWDGPILTDSGGFQVFSLPGLRKIKEDGVEFASPVDGRVRFFSPESVMEIECALGADIIMQLDHCPGHPCSAEDLSAAVERSIRWAKRCVEHHRKVAPTHVNLFGIVQGGSSEALRSRSVDETCSLPFAGMALGGFSVGETTSAMHQGISFSAPKLPVDKPRYLMGMGTPEDILHAVASGMDMFDCTLPTRNGRNALAFTSRGPLRLRNARFAKDERPLDEECTCYTCKTVSRAFLRHLFLAREMNACILTSLHNVAFYLKLMQDLRSAIEERRLESFRIQFLERYGSKEDGSKDAG